jgi:hypothetical protein
MTKARVLLLELNEVSFELVQRYVERGKLPALGRLIAEHGLVQTVSEQKYEELEPWIQWVTAHTGLTYAEHGVFRLGDIVHTDHDQIWERLERQGLKVGAVSPMNAKHRLQSPAFFLPDPWTDTKITADPLVRGLYGAIRQAVNDNATARITPASLAWLGLGWLCFAAPVNYGTYLRLALRSRGAPWRKAAFLDLLIGDLFRHLVKRSRIDFASIFLNGAAHVQHHYMHSSTVAGSVARNPAWYCPADQDPVLEMYEIYDRFVAQVQTTLPTYRLMIATGLHQVPHEEPVFYWRIRNHREFVERLGVSPKGVQPRMSRDFLLEFASEAEAAAAAATLSAVRDLDAQALLEIDNRGRDLFVTFVYPHDIPDDFTYISGNRSFSGLRAEVAFVAIKNGQHDGTGYFIDQGGTERVPQLDLGRVPDLIAQALLERDADEPHEARALSAA